MAGSDIPALSSGVLGIMALLAEEEAEQMLTLRAYHENKYFARDHDEVVFDMRDGKLEVTIHDRRGDIACAIDLTESQRDEIVEYLKGQAW